MVPPAALRFPSRVCCARGRGAMASNRFGRFVDPSAERALFARRSGGAWTEASGRPVLSAVLAGLLPFSAHVLLPECVRAASAHSSV